MRSRAEVEAPGPRWQPMKFERIAADPTVCTGKPCIRKATSDRPITRFRNYTVFDRLLRL